jgi:hypothetical protein
MAMDLVVTLRHLGLSHTIRYRDLPLAEAIDLKNFWQQRGVRDIQTTREEMTNTSDHRSSQ